MKASELIESMQRYVRLYGDNDVIVGNTSFNSVISVNRCADNRLLLVDSSCGQPLGYQPFADVNDMKRWFSAAGLKLEYDPVRSRYTNGYIFHEIKIWKDDGLFGMMRFENFETMLREMWDVFQVVVNEN